MAQIFLRETPFFSKDMSIVWIKNSKGDIKSYELEEIIPKAEKDLQIELLQAQIDELKGKIENDANARNVNEKQNATDPTTPDIPTNPSQTTTPTNPDSSFED